MAEKKEILQHIINSLQLQHDSLIKDQQSLQTALASETKSSAGDKYETGREMITQEINKVGDQLNKHELFIQKLKNIDLKKDLYSVTENALIETSMGIFLIGIPLGIMKVLDEKIFCISVQSPIYQEMRNLKSGDQFSWQGKEIKIVSIS